jgi:sucrose-phosphate synthase
MHGFIKKEPELGRDADTGGQVIYVLNFARALSKHPQVGLVHLITRRIVDDLVDYSQKIEQLDDDGKCFIVRVDCAESLYIRKEKLWPHIPEFVQNCTKITKELAGRQPDLLHSHYADAGQVAIEWSKLEGIPFIHTGHSLGRDKIRSLIAMGVDMKKAEVEYNLSLRCKVE